MAYLAPEVLASGLKAEFRSGAKSDVWSAGMVLARAALSGRLCLDGDVAQVVTRLFRLMNSADVLAELAEDAQARARLEVMSAGDGVEGADHVWGWKSMPVGMGLIL